MTDRVARKMLEKVVEELGGEIFWGIGSVDFYPHLYSNGTLGKVFKYAQTANDRVDALAEELGYEWVNDGMWVKQKKEKK